METDDTVYDWDPYSPYTPNPFVPYEPIGSLSEDQLIVPLWFNITLPAVPANLDKIQALVKLGGHKIVEQHMGFDNSPAFYRMTFCYQNPTKATMKAIEELGLSSLIKLQQPPLPGINPDGALRKAIPALYQKVWCPHKCHQRSPVIIGANCFRSESDLSGIRTVPILCKIDNLIIHLNDNCRWSREKIADWLETLDLDLSFPTPSAEEELH